MANQTKQVLQQLRKVVLLPDGAGLTDGHLLGSFIEGRDEAAFAALVHRHGPMVWGVCRRLLDHHHAEDAFQAAFLVLARKASSVVPREMLANWLYGVAHQAALQARRTVARRGARERQVTQMPEPPAATERDCWDDLRPLLDQELSRLPDKYRAIIVLSDLEGKTRSESARQLGLPEGTVASRLTRARAMLAKRLARRGVTLSGGALAVVLSQKAASAGVPSSAISSTIKAASFVAAGQGAGPISVKVAALTQGVLKTMLLKRLKSVMAVALAAAALAGVGAGLLAHAKAAGGQGRNGDAVAPRKEVAQAEERGKAKEEADKGKGRKDLPKADKEKLQGTWVVVSEEYEGKPVAKEDVRPQWWSFEGDTLTVFSIDRRVSKPEKTEYTFSLAADKSPKVIEMTGGRRVEGPRTKSPDDMKAIYKVEGDSLTIAVGKGELPKEFKTKEGDKVFLAVLKREGAAQEKPAADGKGEKP